MLGVTAETAASVSLPNARLRPAWDDQPSSPDSFGALVDASLQNTNTQTAPPPASQPNTTANQQAADTPAPTQSANTPDPPSDNYRSRDRHSSDDASATGSQTSARGQDSTGTTVHHGKSDGGKPVSTKETSDEATLASDAAGTTSSSIVVPQTPLIPIPATAVITPVASPATAADATNAVGAATAAAQSQQAAVAANETTTIASKVATVTTEAVTIAAQATADADSATAEQTPEAAVQTAGTGLLAMTAAGTTSGTKSAKTADVSSATSTVDVATGIPQGESSGSGQTATGPSAPVTGAQPAGDATHKHDGSATDSQGNGTTSPDSSQTSGSATTAAPHAAHASDDGLQPQGQSVDASQQAASASVQTQGTTTPATQTPQYSVAVATTAPVPLNGLAVQIAVTAQSGKSRFEIRLDPADLGRIDVRLDVDQQGQVTSHLTVEKPETLALLRQDAPQLQRALQDAGLKTGDGGLQFSLRDQSSSGQNTSDDGGRNAHRLVVTEDDAAPTPTAGLTYGRMLGSSSGLDIRV